MIFETSIKNPEKIHYLGEDQNERIKYLFRRSTLTLIPSFITFFILTVIPVIIVPLARGNVTQFQSTEAQKLFNILVMSWYLFCTVYLFHALVVWFYNVYLITNKKILDVDFRGLLYTNVSEATLDHIEDVTSEVKGLGNTLFDIGNVYIQTAGESPQFEFTQVKDPSSIRDIIADLVSLNRRKNHGKNE